MTRSPSIMQHALALFNVRLVLQQIGLALLVFALSVIWLRIPDASAIDVAASILLAFIVIGIAGAGESALILRLADQERTLGRLVRGTLFLLLAVMLWIACDTLLNHLQASDSLRAGYLNSQFRHSRRNVFSYEHVLLWLGWLWTLLQSFCIGLIALITVTSTASCNPGRAIKRILHSVAYWIAIVVGIPCAIVLTNGLMQWTPAHGFRIETLSLVLRLGISLLADSVIACLLLAILIAYVRQENVREFLSGDTSKADRSTPAGMPEESQPRTADSP